jgi:hypothetical protein
METAQGMSQGQDTAVSSPGLTPSAPSAQHAPAQPTEERFFKQSELNDIVKKAKYGAVEDYKRLQSEQPNYAQQKYGDGQQPHQAPIQQHASQPDENHYRKIAAEEAQRLRDQWVKEAQSKSDADNAQRIVQNFWQKISPGREKYQDFDKVTGDIEYGRFQNVVQLLADYVDNSHDVLYELGKDRFKLAQLEQLAYMSPKDAIVQAQRLSQSLKDNEASSNRKLPNEPLSQMRPSNTGTDNGVMSVKDYRAKYRV